MAGFGHIFEDPDKKKEMLDHWVTGASYPQLALYYGVDHTTIVYHVKKAGLSRVGRKQRSEIVRHVENGTNIKEVAKLYSTSVVSVSAYCARAGVKGHKLLSSLKKLVLQIRPPTTRKKRKWEGKKQVAIPIPNRYGQGATNSSYEQILKKQEEAEEKKRVQERVKMLCY